MASGKSIFERKSDCTPLIRCPYDADICNVSSTTGLSGNKTDNIIALAPNTTHSLGLNLQQSLVTVTTFTNDTTLLLQYNFLCKSVELFK